MYVQNRNCVTSEVYYYKNLDLRSLMANCGISTEAKVVYAFFCAYEDCIWKNTVDVLEHHLGLSKDELTFALEELRNNGYLYWRNSIFRYAPKIVYYVGKVDVTKG